MQTSIPPRRGKLNLHYYLLQIGFWGGIGCFTGFQSVILLGRGFTSADVGVFVAVCNLAGILFQPWLGAWADRHPEISLKRIFLCCILAALALNLVFLFTRPGYLLTGLFFLFIGMAEVNSFTLIDAMAMQYLNAGAEISYSRGRGLGSLSYALMCILVGRQTALFGVESALVTHAVMLALLAIFILSFPAFPQEALPRAEERGTPHSALAILQGNLPFALMLLAGFFGMMAVMPVDNFLINIIEGLGGNSSHLGLALFLKAASELPAAFLFERLYRKLGCQKVLLLSVAFMIAKPILFLLSGSLPVFLLVQPIQMLGYGLFTPGAAYFANENVAPEDRTQGQSMKSMPTGLASVSGNLIFGYAVTWGGTTAMLGFAAVSGAVGLLFALAALRASRKAALSCPTKVQ